MVFVLIPVFNRLVHTQRVLQALREQTQAGSLRIVFIDDGSTDGTGEFLAAQLDVHVITGDGNLWWGGAIEEGLKYVQAQGSRAEDYVLFLNNDTWFAADYIDILVRASQEHGGAAMGSVIHEEEREQPLISIGARVDINRCAVWDVLSELSPDEVANPLPVYKVDALSGRGTLYPAYLFEKYGRMRPCLLPHYTADYELAMRFSRHGVPLLVSTKAIVFSPPVYGNDVSKMTRWQRLFSRRSAANIIHRLFFYMLVGSPLQRLGAPFRVFGIAALHKLSAWKS